MREPIDFLILGPLDVRRRGQSVPLGGPKQRALLALLLLHRNEVVSRDRLVDELWPNAMPANPSGTLQLYVSRLRKSLGAARIVTRPPGYMISVAPGELDLDRFEQLVSQARDDPPHAHRLLRDAVSIWRGEAFADLEEEGSIRAEAARLEEVRVATLEDCIEKELARGAHAELVPELEALVAVHPFRERLWAALMRALHGAGRKADALGVYETARRTFADALGLEPSSALRGVQQDILRDENQAQSPAAFEPVARRLAGHSASVDERRHAEHYLALVEEAEPWLRGEEGAFWLEDIHGSRDSIRSAIEWSRRSGEKELELRFAVALAQFWYFRGYLNEGVKCLRGALDGSDTTPLRLRAAAARAIYLFAAHIGRYDEAVASAELARSLYQGANDPRGVAESLLDLGDVSVRLGDFARAKVLDEKALALYSAQGDEAGSARALNDLGEVTCLAGDPAQSEAIAVEALERYRLARDEQGIGISLTALGFAQLDCGRLVDAAKAFATGARLFNKRADPYGLGRCLEGLGGTLARAGEYERAAVVLGASGAMRLQLGTVLFPPEARVRATVEGLMQRQLGRAKYMESLADGAVLDGPSAMRYALSGVD